MMKVDSRNSRHVEDIENMKHDYWEMWYTVLIYFLILTHFDYTPTHMFLCDHFEEETTADV